MKKAGMVFGALLLGLLVISATYAYWTQSLNIAGTVSTGYLQVKMTNVTTYDNENTYDVGTIVATINNATSATITIGNAYPGYNATAVFTINNTGTIPVKLSATIGTYNTTALNVSTSFSGLDANGVLLPNGTATLTVNTSVTNGATQNATYTYNITVTATQFNAP